MNVLTQAKAMAAYNAWMNEKVYAACARLTDEQRKRDVSAFFRSIHGTLNHILLADRIWMGRFTGRPFAAKALDDELDGGFDDLWRERRQEDQRITAWVQGLTEAALQGALSYVSMVNPQPRTYPLWFAVAHVFNHQTHHRGQVTTMLFQQGVDVGVTDLLMLPEFQAP